MRRPALTALALALLAVPTAARAQAITYTTDSSAFGPAISLLGIGDVDYGSVNNFDLGNGITLTSDGGLFNDFGLYGFTFATFSGLGAGSGVSGIGFTWGEYTLGADNAATFSNGGSDPSRSLPDGVSFSGYTSTTSFTSVTITNDALTLQLTDFRLIAATAAIPEPTGLVSGGVLALAGGGAALARRRRRK